MAIAAKKRGGHNQRQNVVRYPSGDVNESATRAHRLRMQETAETRMRVFGIHRHQAESNKASTVFGRMYLQGELGPIAGKDGKRGAAEDALEAGEEFARRHAANLAAIACPAPPRSGSDLSGGGRHIGANTDDEGYIERCAAARRRYSEIRRVCLEADPFALMAMETIVVEDKYSDVLAGALRVACNAIARMTRQERRA